jgi:hypothetical protein
MTKAEWVTDFKLEGSDGAPVTLSAIVKAVEEHCKAKLEGETFHNCAKGKASANRRPSCQNAGGASSHLRWTVIPKGTTSTSE